MGNHEFKRASLRKIVLDNGVFRKLVKSNTSQAKVQGILDFINGLLPVRLVATFGLWSEYVGLPRPILRNIEGYQPFADLKSIEALNDVLSSTIESLIDSYRSDPALQPTNLEAVVSTFISKRVSSKIEDAKNIAVDIVHFEGQDFYGKPFSWDALANQLAIEFAIDELFYLIRFMPTDLVDAVGVFTRQMAGTLKEFKHLPMYRLAESIVKYIWRVHDESPDETSVNAKKTIAKAMNGVKPLTPEEMGDCNYLWASIQGMEGNTGLDSVTVITFDTQSRNRLRMLIDIFAAELAGKRLLVTLMNEELLSPGRILVLCDKSCTVKDDIDVKKLVEEKLNEVIEVKEAV